MKNKILKKIILVVVCITVVVSALVLPSFAIAGDYATITPNSLNTEERYDLGNNTLLFHPYSRFYTNAFNTDLQYYCVPFIDNISAGSALGFGTFQKDFDSFSSLFSINRVNRAYSVVSGATDYIFAIYDVGIGTSSAELFSSIRYDTLEFSFECNAQEYHFGPYRSFNNCIFLDTNLALGDTVIYTYQVNYSDANGVVQTYSQDIVAKVTQYPSTNAYLTKGLTLYFNQLPSDIDYNFVWEVNFYNFRDVNGNLADLTSSRYNLQGFGGNEQVIRYGYRSPIRTDINMDTDDTLDAILGGVPEAEYNRGLNEGFDEGYVEGYDIGYDEGFNLGSSVGSSSPFDFIMNAVSSFVDWEFIPGVSIGIILTIIVGVVLIITFLKFFAGG